MISNFHFGLKQFVQQDLQRYQSNAFPRKSGSIYLVSIAYHDLEKPKQEYNFIHFALNVSLMAILVLDLSFFRSTLIILDKGNF